MTSKAEPERRGGGGAKGPCPPPKPWNCNVTSSV